MMTRDTEQMIQGLARAVRQVCDGLRVHTFERRHAEDVSVMLIVWHIGGVMGLAALAASAGRLLLNWRSITAASENAVQ